MDCLICGEDAVELDTGRDVREQKCPECGHFSVTRTLLATQRDRQHQVEQTRAWLERFREARPGELPVISDATASGRCEPNRADIRLASCRWWPAGILI
jgi:predicted RNA-binding Zn-ribbon protein involved in translation (DUF1610 family)